MPRRRIDQNAAPNRIQLPEITGERFPAVPEGQEEAYGEALGFKMFPITEQLDRQVEDINGRNPNPVYENQPTPDQLNSYFENAGLLKNRVLTHASDFTFYLMGVKDMSIEEAAKVLPGSEGYAQHIKDFHTFLKEHPINEANEGQEPLTEEKREENAKAWSDLFIKCGNKFKEYRFPDIDYANPEEVAPHINTLALISRVSQDFGQEAEAIRINFGAYIRKVSGGYENFLKAEEAWANVRTLSDVIKDGILNNPVKGSAAKRHEQVNMSAVANVFLNKKMDIFKGKTLEEVTKGDAKRFYYFNSYQKIKSKYAIAAMQANMVGDAMPVMPGMVPEEGVTLNLKDAVDYLQGKNTRFEEDIEPVIDRTAEESRKEKEATYSNTAREDFSSRFCAVENVQLRAELDELQQANLDGQEIYNRLIGEDKKKTLTHMLSFMRVFDRDDGAYYRRIAGVELLDSIRIDGKRPAELWGEKYAFVQDPVEKQYMYIYEILQEYKHGTKEMTMDDYRIMANNQVTKTGVVYLAKGKEALRRGYTILADADALHRDLIRTKEGLNRALEAVPQAERNRLTANVRYREMMDAMQQCIDLSDTNTNQGNICRLSQALVTYQEKAAAYEIERDKEKIRVKVAGKKSTLSRKAEAAEKLRYKVAKDAKADITVRMERLQRLSAGLGIIEPGSASVENGISKFPTLKSALDTEASNRSFSQNDLQPIGKNEPTDPEFDWIMNPNEEQADALWEDGFSEEQIRSLTKLAGLENGPKYTDELMRQGQAILDSGEGREHNKDVIANVGFSNRPDTTHGIFLVWLMGQKGFSVAELAKTLSVGKTGADGRPLYHDITSKLPQLYSEFITFCKEHPQEGENLSVEDFKENKKAWATVLKNATDRMREYRLPDVDYTDTKQVQGIMDEIIVLRTLGINFGQDMPKIMLATHPEAGGIATTDSCLGGPGEYQKIYCQWLNLQTIFDEYTNTFAFPVANDLLNAGRTIARNATIRALVGTYCNERRGRSMGVPWAKFWIPKATGFWQHWKEE